MGYVPQFPLKFHETHGIPVFSISVDISCARYCDGPEFSSAADHQVRRSTFMQTSMHWSHLHSL